MKGLDVISAGVVTATGAKTDARRSIAPTLRIRQERDVIEPPRAGPGPSVLKCCLRSAEGRGIEDAVLRKAMAQEAFGRMMRMMRSKEGSRGALLAVIVCAMLPAPGTVAETLTLGESFPLPAAVQRIVEDLPVVSWGSSFDEALKAWRLYARQPAEATGSPIPPGMLLDQLARLESQAWLARQLLDAHALTGGTGASLARLGAVWQAGQQGGRIPDQGRDTLESLPSEVIRWAAEGRGVAVGSEAAEALRQYDVLPLDERRALVGLLGAFLEVEAASAEAFGSGNPSREGFAAVLAARVRVVEAAAALSGALEPRMDVPDLRLPPFLAVEFSGADSVYDEDYAFLVDVGGNDRYVNNAGGSGLQGACFGGAAGLLVDLEGDDAYGDGRDCGANGGAAYGVGFLWDDAGNDTYVAAFSQESAGTNGGGFFGVGFLFDGDGQDRYLTDNIALGGGAGNGGAVNGAGFLFDADGNDVYRGGRTGTNGGGSSCGLCGSAFGQGFLFDGGGDDVYVAHSVAGNGGAFATASSGFLLDVSGNDSYLESPLGGELGFNGGAMFRAVGFLLDAGDGTDRYVASDGFGGFGVNGGAMEASIGFLVDLGGSDNYDGDSIGVNGGGVNLAVGFLYDAGGADRYSGKSMGVNGGAFGAVGVLVDRGGDDSYVAGVGVDSFDPGDGGVNGGATGGCTALCLLDPEGAPRNPGVGLLVDEAGFDTYHDNEGGTGVDRTVLSKGLFGTQLDLPG